MEEKIIITISRELGSGGRTVGRKLAEALGVRYSDKELISKLRNKFQLSAVGIEKLKGEKKTWFSEFLQMVAPVRFRSSGPMLPRTMCSRPRRKS